MACILHITRDYPDQIDSQKTKAVSNLVYNVRGFDHYVLSLNRTTQPGNERILYDGSNLYSVVYLVMPYGLLLRHFLIRIAKQIYDLIKRDNIRPDLIHCHKLTHEGIIGYYLSKRLGIPLACSIRGDTDLRMIQLKPNYSALYRRIIDHASCVFFIAPWTLDKIKQWGGEEVGGKGVILPNIVNLTFGNVLNKQVITNRFVTVCHLNVYRRKNVSRIIRAVDRCISGGNDVSLDIIGGGSEAMVKRAKKDISKSCHPQRFRLLGGIEHSKVVSSLHNYVGLVLPSYPETFGMVYFEALQSGIPFIHSRNAGVDGYFSENQISISVNPKSVKSIQAGVTELFTNQQTYKENIKSLTDSGCLDKFNTPDIVKVYEDTMARIL